MVLEILLSHLESIADLKTLVHKELFLNNSSGN